MPQSKYLHLIGINTGNSLDAADLVLTKFGLDRSIADIDSLSVPMPRQLADQLRDFRTLAVALDGDMEKAKSQCDGLYALIDRYTRFVADAVTRMRSQRQTASVEVDAIGLHGQTCAHKPYSIAGDRNQTYTLQLGNGQLLADLTGLPVVFDFRSDDLMNGGEGAPLAPTHHKHLGEHAKLEGHFPICFLNAGNTGNISVITEEKNRNDEIAVFGWDTGPFNEYPDRLMRLEKNELFDRDGQFGLKGQVNLDLLKLLFDGGAVTNKGENFLLQAPPKSSDPQWYRFLPEILGECGIGGKEPLSFENRIATCEYFAAYVFFYSLSWIKENYQTPIFFALCGGGWHNPVAREGFKELVETDNIRLILPEHQKLFAHLRALLKQNNRKPEVDYADHFGFSGQFMEARLFADAAFCRIKGEAFTQPSMTGCRSNTVLGIIRHPKTGQRGDSTNLADWLSEFKSANLTVDRPDLFDERWSRASRGWAEKIKTQVS